jgi:3-oxo-4-pregnene-20-carboxyl-CoA dehydrogenase alpha subunit
VPIAISPEQRALQASIREWANQAGTIALVRRLEPRQVPRVVAREPAAWAEHWKALADLGIFSIVLPAAVGGADGTVADLAAALEELAHALAPGPVLPTLLAGLLLRGQADHPAAKSLLPALASGQASAAVGLAANTLTGTWHADGTLQVSGEVGPVLGAGATSHLLLGASAEDAKGVGTGEVWFLIPGSTDDGAGRSAARSRAVADLYQLTLAGACCLADGALAGALALTTEHVAARHQFGRPLATFQAVAQHIADVAIASRTLHLAALSGCWRLDTGRETGPDLDVAAYWLADQAPTALRTCHHLHGGTGMDVSYPLYRYSALVKDLVRLVGGADYRLGLLAAGARDVP